MKKFKLVYYGSVEASEITRTPQVDIEPEQLEKFIKETRRELVYNPIIRAEEIQAEAGNDDGRYTIFIVDTFLADLYLNDLEDDCADSIDSPDYIQTECVYVINEA